MKKVKKLTNRIGVMLMSSMLIVGAVHGTVLASEKQADFGQTSEIAAEVPEETDTEIASVEAPEETDTEIVSVEAYSEDDITQEEAVEAQYYTVTLDANGGYFENEWDDVLGDYSEKTEILNKIIPVGGTVSTYPVNEQEGVVEKFLGWSLERDGEIVWQDQEDKIAEENEGYAPVKSCVLYAVWRYEDTTEEAVLHDDSAEIVKESDSTNEAVEENSLPAVNEDVTEDVSQNNTEALVGKTITFDNMTSRDDQAEDGSTDNGASTEEITSEAEPETVVSNQQFSSVNTPADGNRYTVLLMDTSGSMGNNSRIVIAKRAAIRFCEQMLAADGINYISIVSYASSIKSANDFTNNVEVLKNQINTMSADGGTNTNAALNQAVELLNYAPEKAKKNVVLLSDGLPEDGEQLLHGKYFVTDHTLYMYGNQVYSTAKSIDQDWNIYTLGFFQGLNNNDEIFARKLMEDIQNRGFYLVNDPNDLEYEFEKIAKDVTEIKLDHWSFNNSNKAFDNQYRINKSDWNWLKASVTPKDLARIIEKYTKKPFHISSLKEMYKTVNENLKIWKGSCFGMSAWCSLVACGYNSPEEIDGKGMLSQYGPSNKIQSAINKYHVLQSTDFYMNQLTEYFSKDKNAQIEELENFLSLDNPNRLPVMINFQMREYYSDNEWHANAGHAVVGYRLRPGEYTKIVREEMDEIGRGGAIDPSWEFTESISLYDPNFPDNIEYIYISKNTDTFVWCYPTYGIISSNGYARAVKTIFRLAIMHFLRTVRMVVF